MPEDVHLLVSEPRNGGLSRALQALKLSVAVRRSERPFWLARYYDFNVHTHDKHMGR
jgi:putative transposase